MLDSEPGKLRELIRIQIALTTVDRDAHSPSHPVQTTQVDEDAT